MTESTLPPVRDPETAESPPQERIPVLYLAPWVDFGGTDKNTIDWFRHIDRERFAPSIITTQPSPNRRLSEIEDFAEEIWILPDLMPGEQMPRFILEFIVSRKVGIVHLMNSRLGFDLLPDMTCLPDQPGIVVQLHVEEADRSGYVRYVTTRYGNLVDGFSIASRHLAAAVHDYGISSDKTEVIYIGVDAEREFNPELVEPIEGLAEDKFQIAFPARLTDQKDPLLMVEVAAALRKMGVDFQIQVLGEGPLEDEVRARIAAHELEEQVLLHPPTPTPQRWYAACDAMLLTSVFEGVPAVVYEAMAMELPVVASALPGNAELLSSEREEASLIDPRDDVGGYAEALGRLARDPSHAEAVGRDLRARALEQFSLRRMAAEHGELYEKVLAERPSPAAPSEEGPPPPLRFGDRPQEGTPLVSVIVPHYNQGGVLGDCIDSIWAQTYPEIELIVVDDASTEATAKEVLDALEEHDDLTLLRLDANGGPSKARNRGIKHSSGRYVLPVDADNVLLPDAVEKLVAQLSAAGEDVGFIYPNLQYFGNREDYFEAPEYSVFKLTHGNFCDTCSLLDRSIFEAGEFYSEDIHLGHEDWEFVLRLAARGVRGEAAHGPTVRYRKLGFNRSDEVDHSAKRFEGMVAESSFFGDRLPAIKAAEIPALSVGCLQTAPDDAAAALRSRLSGQTCLDLELIAPGEDREAEPAEGPQIQRVPPALAAEPGAALKEMRLRMRGSLRGVTTGDGADLLADPAFCEKVLRRFATAKRLDALAFVDCGDDAALPFQPIGPDHPAAAERAHTIVWTAQAEARLPRGLHADPGDPAHSLALLFNGAGGRVEWHHSPGPGGDGTRQGTGDWTAISPPRQPSVEELAHPTKPLLPGEGEFEVPRWEHKPSWVPVLSALLIRYREPHGSRRIVTPGPRPPGWQTEFHLGSIPQSSLQGTQRLLRVGGEFRTEPLGEWYPVPEGGEELGYVEEVGLPQWKMLAIVVHRVTGEQTLALLPDDPILEEADLVRVAGFVEPLPHEPKAAPDTQRTLGLVGLVQSVDQQARRHRYALGAVPPGEVSGELGALAGSDLQGSIGAWIEDGWLVTENHRPPRPAPGALTAARWAMEPAAWRTIAAPKARLKVGLRRGAIAAGNRLSRGADSAPPQPGAPEAWLYASERPGMVPLYAAYHPITGDQLLSRNPVNAPQLGYGPAERLGFIRMTAPVTGDTFQQHLPLPWARRFGAVPRSQ